MWVFAQRVPKKKSSETYRTDLRKFDIFAQRVPKKKGHQKRIFLLFRENHFHFPVLPSFFVHGLGKGGRGNLRLVEYWLLIGRSIVTRELRYFSPFLRTFFSVYLLNNASYELPRVYDLSRNTSIARVQDNCTPDDPNKNCHVAFYTIWKWLSHDYYL